MMATAAIIGLSSAILGHHSVQLHQQQNIIVVEGSSHFNMDIPTNKHAVSVTVLKADVSIVIPIALMIGFKKRYAPETQLWRGRLHVMGGNKKDRHELELEHWSFVVKNWKALEKEWRIEVPIPRGGPQ